MSGVIEFPKIPEQQQRQCPHTYSSFPNRIRV